MKEEWRDIQDFIDYQVSNKGRIKSFYTDKIRKTSISNSGYERIVLCNDCNKQSKSVHRLVALAFLPNPENYPEVDHIDRDKLNNNISNLRWVPKSVNNSNKDKWFIGTNTGEPYISYDKFGNRYKVQKKPICKYFKTLEEAIQFRDTIIVT